MFSCVCFFNYIYVFYIQGVHIFLLWKQEFSSGMFLAVYHKIFDRETKRDILFHNLSK